MRMSNPKGQYLPPFRTPTRLYAEGKSTLTIQIEVKTSKW